MCKSWSLDLELPILSSPDAEVIWYIYTGITHAYSDGASGNALLQDLLRLYAEAGGNAVSFHRLWGFY